MRKALFITTIIFSITLNACSLDSLVRVDDPDQAAVISREHVNSYSGAVGMYYSAIASTMTAMSGVSRHVGLITDELVAWTWGSESPSDKRYSTTEFGIELSVYNQLQTARIRAAQASEALLRFGNEGSHSLVGHTYALQGLTHVLLAELFCSGIPLTTVPFEGDMMYTEGLSTEEVLQRAIALFDTAFEYGGDSLPIATLARVGKARALLGLKLYDEAASAVSNVATDDKYSFQYSLLDGGVRFWNAGSVTLTLINNEGDNGLLWYNEEVGADPRVPAFNREGQFNANFNGMFQTKYTSEDPTVIIASGVQARLVEAEAQLNSDGPWLQTLNELRSAVGLPDTVDPGTVNGRVDLLFRERAFWLYLEGHRLGDMRRLVRQYNRLQHTVFPTGPIGVRSLTGSGYKGGEFYGEEVLFVPPQSERNLNPYYKGCDSRSA